MATAARKAIDDISDIVETPSILRVDVIREGRGFFSEEWGEVVGQIKQRSQQQRTHDRELPA